MMEAALERMLRATTMMTIAMHRIQRQESARPGPAFHGHETTTALIERAGMRVNDVETMLWHAKNRHARYLR